MVGSMVGPLHMEKDGYYDNNRHWRPSVHFLPDDERVMPETVPHDWIKRHRLDCRCEPCARYPEKILQDLRRAARSSARHRG